MKGKYDFTWTLKGSLTKRSGTVLPGAGHVCTLDKEMSQRVKVFAVKTDEFDPSGAHMVEREN